MAYVEWLISKIVIDETTHRRIIRHYTAIIFFSFLFVSSFTCPLLCSNDSEQVFVLYTRSFRNNECIEEPEKVSLTIIEKYLSSSHICGAAHEDMIHLANEEHAMLTSLDERAETSMNCMKSSKDIYATSSFIGLK